MHSGWKGKKNAHRVPQVTKNNNFLQSLGHALNGLWLVVKDERNMRFHIIASILVIAIGFYFKIGRSDWLWICVAITSVITAEFLNTIVEAIVDLVMGNQYHELAKTAKDVAAASTLIAAAFAVVIGLLIFAPYIYYFIELHS